MCFDKLFNKEPKKPDIQETLSMPSHMVLTELLEQKIGLIYPTLMDSGQAYFYTTAQYWAEVMDYIYFKVDKPAYVEVRMDCDDFAFWMKGLVAGFFGLNWFGVVLGDTPAGYHAWNILRTEEGVMQFEPQTGEFFPIGEKGYVPENVWM